jgi:hypothetical protein
MRKMVRNDRNFAVQLTELIEEMRPLDTGLLFRIGSSNGRPRSQNRPPTATPKSVAPGGSKRT